MAIFLGIDGGGTRTTCLVGDEVSVLGTGSAGGSNIVRVGESQARDNLQQAIRQACEAAKVVPQSVRAACIGVAGASVPEVNATVQRAARDVVPAPLQVVGDMVVAIEDAFGETPGVLVIAGTGSIAYGRNQSGQTARAGGWGWAISDEGSGHWIGRTAVAEVMRAHDSSQETSLAQQVLRAWNLPDLPALVRQANSTPPPDYPGLVPNVLVAADAGDGVARSVVVRAAGELARLCDIVIRRLWTPEQQVRVAIGGGVFAHSPLLRHAFFNTMRAMRPNLSLTFRIVNAAQGALALARKSAAKTESAGSGIARRHG